jgi:hypothetical protein
MPAVAVEPAAVAAAPGAAAPPAAPELAFDSEEARLKAMDELPETPENLAKLNAMLAAPLKPAAETPAAGEAIPPAAAPAAPAAAAPAPAAAQPPAPAGTPGVAAEPPVPLSWQGTTSELPKGPNGETYKSVAEVMKAFANQGELIGRQTRFIREKLGTTAAPTQPAAAGEPAAPAARPAAAPAPASPAAPAPAAPGVPSSAAAAPATTAAARLAEIRKLQAELAASDDPLLDANIKKRDSLNALLIEQLDSVTQALGAQSEVITAAQREVADVRQRSDRVFATEEQQQQQRRIEAALTEEYKVMEGIGQEYPEMKLSRPAAEIDKRYLDWGNQVASLHYGRPPANLKEVHAALHQLELRSPELVNKCQLAQVPTQPDQDVQNYLAVCEMLDYRDGKRTDPITGVVSYAERVDPATGQKIVDRFPGGVEGLRAAIEFRRVNDGYYRERINKARAEGGQAALQAAQRRDAGAVEISSGEGAASGGQVNVLEAVKLRDAIDEEEAMRRARAGDRTLLDEYNKYNTLLGGRPVEFTGYTYRQA